jgi:tetratricopeptide (TPR) repeat protein
LDTTLPDLLNMARRAVAAGEYETGLQLATRLRHLAPEDPQGWFISVSMLRELRRFDDLDALLLGASEDIFFDYGIMSIWASIPRIQREWPEALRRAQQMIDRYPDGSKGYHHAIYAIDQLRDYEWTLREIDELMHRFPDDHNIIAPAADVAMRHNDWDRATALWERFEKLYPGSAGRRRSYIISLMRSSDTTLASAICEQSMKEFPDDSRIAFLWAEEPMSRQDWSIAVERWAALRVRWSHLAEPYLRAAHALRQLGRSIEADELLEFRRATFCFQARSISRL